MPCRVGVVVAEKEGFLSVINQKKIGVTVAVVITHDDGAAPTWIIETAAGGDVGEGDSVTVAAVEQVWLGIGRAAGPQRAGGDTEIDEAVQVIVEEDRPPGDALVPGPRHHILVEPGGGGHVGKCAPVVMEQ